MAPLAESSLVKICPACRTVYHEDAPICPHDGASLLDLQADDARCGTVIDERYLVISQLGAGGMGTVYRAWQFSTDRLVALKLLHADLGAHKNATERFMREARVTAGLTNPHVVRVHDFGQLADGTAYMAMELIDGVPLDALIDGPMAPERALELVRQICIALEEAHAQGLVHRDLKPGNIIVRRLADGGEFAQVLDFGIAKVLDETRTALTHENQNPGTPAYMSPEQARNAPVGPPSDLYALSVMLFEMLVGERPFVGTSAMSVLLQHVQAEPPSLKARCPDLPGVESLDAVIRRGLAKQPQTRYTSAAELRTEIERLKSGETPEALSNPPPALKEKRRFGINMQALGCSVQLAVAVGALAFFVLPALRDDSSERFAGLDEPAVTNAPTTSAPATSAPVPTQPRLEPTPLAVPASVLPSPPPPPGIGEPPQDIVEEPKKRGDEPEPADSIVDQEERADTPPADVPKEHARKGNGTPKIAIGGVVSDGGRVGTGGLVDGHKKHKETERDSPARNKAGRKKTARKETARDQDKRKRAASPVPKPIKPASPQLLERAVRTHRDRVRRECGAGPWPLELMVAPEGTVQRARITQPGRAAHGKAGCVLRIIRGLQLPPPGRPTPLRLTL